uniref:Outer membrane protein (Porin) n=1 Tax=Candidatus Kentrum sp. LFY TaxID=2126342 RepID=A0A450V2S4_9GAMM|nr:MAG: Outer membrane protein (porin) [Candidatus Kentron sp. LFY]
MQKKLLSLAIAGALAIPGAAMADLKNVDVYGKIHASWDFVDTESTNDDSDDNTGAFRNARLGFKGEEKISDTLKAEWQVETELNTADDTNQMKFRNTFVGIKGDKWGTVRFGKHDTPYKLATAKLDIFTDTIADYNNIIGAHIADPRALVDANNVGGNVASNFNERPGQVVAYITPNFNGFEAAIARASIQNDEGNTAGVSLENQEAWSAMAKYDNGSFFASLAYEVFEGGMHQAMGVPAADTTDGDLDAWKIGLGYQFSNPGKTRIGFVYEDIEQDTSSAVANDITFAKKASRDAYGVNFAHDFGANTIKLAYFKADDSDVSNSDDGADNWSIGLDHNFSKRTKIYGIYTRMDNDKNANYGLYGGQGAGKEDNGFYTSDQNGKDIDAFSVGIVHKF